MEFDCTFNFMEGGYENNIKAPSPEVPVQVKSKPAKEPTIAIGKYDSDISALRDKYGDLFTNGLCITIDLQELLLIAPRNRRRIESFQGLVSELKKMGIELNIKSRKTK